MSDEYPPLHCERCHTPRVDLWWDDGDLVCTTCEKATREEGEAEQPRRHWLDLPTNVRGRPRWYVDVEVRDEFL